MLHLYQIHTILTAMRIEDEIKSNCTIKYFQKKKWS
jgi:hypothetical protein